MLKTMKHTFLKFCAALIAFAGLNVFSPDASAQENTPVGGGGTVSGTVTDSQGPVAGAAVMIKDGKLYGDKKPTEHTPFQESKKVTFSFSHSSDMKTPRLHGMAKPS